MLLVKEEGRSRPIGIRHRSSIRWQSSVGIRLQSTLQDLGDFSVPTHYLLDLVVGVGRGL